MQSLNLGLFFNPPMPAKANPVPLIAWGDSLTAQGYPSMAGQLFSPARAVINKGLGGQGSYSIAARQGGRPLYVSVADNTIPARTDVVRSWNFETGAPEWYGTNIVWSGGKLVTNAASWLQGPNLALEQSLPNGRQFTVEFDIEMTAGLTVRVSGITDGVWAANRGPGTDDGFDITASGHYAVTLYAGRLSGTPATMDALCFLTTNGNTGSFSIDNVVLTIPSAAADYAVAVSAKNNNILSNGGVFMGTAAGTVSGVHGLMSTDASGNWTFARGTSGPAVACPPNSQFVLDEPPLYRDYTAWVWAGNNGVNTTADAAATKADIASMIDYMAHNRFLVLSVLPSATASAAQLGVLQQLNRDLASLYGHRFVDVFGALLASGNGSAEDNADIAAGIVPRSLRVDGIHLTATGSQIVAQNVYTKMMREGW